MTRAGPTGPTSRPSCGRRRRRAGTPAEERHRPKWRLALDVLDELASWGLVPPVVAADVGDGNNGEFRAGLAERGWS